MTRTQNSPNALLQHTFENAVRVNNAAQVEQLIKDAPDFQTPQLSLQWAAWRGDAAEVTKWLAHPHAYPSAQSFQALRWAAKNGHANIVALLIPAIEPSRRPVVFTQALRWAAQNGHAEAMALITLQWAAGRGDAEVTKWLAQPHADPSAQSSQALLWAAKNGHANIVALLIPTIEPSRCPVALTQALRWAAQNGHAEATALLIPLNPPSSLDAALQQAAEFGHGDVVELLVGATAPSAAGWALVRAAKSGHTSLVERLIPLVSATEAKTEGAEADSHLQLGLYWAAIKGHASIVALLFPVSPAQEVWSMLMAARRPEAIEELAKPASREWLQHALASVPPQYAEQEEFKRLRARAEAPNNLGVLTILPHDADFLNTLRETRAQMVLENSERVRAEAPNNLGFLTILPHEADFLNTLLEHRARAAVKTPAPPAGRRPGSRT